MNDVQALFLLIYSITYVTALANWPPDTFATATFFARKEWDATHDKWEDAQHKVTRAQLRFAIGSIFGSVFPLTYLGLAIVCLSGPYALESASSWVTVLRTVLVGLGAIAPHAFHRFFMSVLFQFDSHLVDCTPRVDKYLSERKGGDATRVRHHVEGGFFQLGISVGALVVLILTRGI